METLKIVIKKEWFDQIANGTKKIEYRDISPFWESRLLDKEGKKRKYDRIEFINGYNTDARRMVTGFEGVSERGGLFYVKIGKIYKRG